MLKLGVALLTLWFFLKVVLHKGGYIHLVLVAALAVLVVWLMAYRNAQYHKTSAGQ